MICANVPKNYYRLKEKKRKTQHSISGLDMIMSSNSKKEKSQHLFIRKKSIAAEQKCLVEHSLYKINNFEMKLH